MSQTAEQLKKLVNTDDTGKTDNAAAAPENYKTRPENRQTKGYLATNLQIVPPLTEKSRTEESFVVTAGGTVYVPTQIIFTDAAGKEVEFNFAMPTVS